MLVAVGRYAWVRVAHASFHHHLAMLADDDTLPFESSRWRRSTGECARTEFRTAT